MSQANSEEVRRAGAMKAHDLLIMLGFRICAQCVRIAKDIRGLRKQANNVTSDDEGSPSSQDSDLMVEKGSDTISWGRRRQYEEAKLGLGEPLQGDVRNSCAALRGETKDMQYVRAWVIASAAL